MSKQQLALPAPWGFGDGYSVTLSTREDFNPTKAKQAVMKFGCPERVADKAVSCLVASDRYDCVLNPLLIKEEQHRLRMHLSEAGIELTVTRAPNEKEPGRAIRKARQLRDQVLNPNSQYSAIVAEENRRQRQRLNALAIRDRLPAILQRNYLSPSLPRVSAYRE